MPRTKVLTSEHGTKFTGSSIRLFYGTTNVKENTIEIPDTA